MDALNYAKEYQKALEQQFPYALYFGDLYATPNNNRYKWLNGDTIEIPSITTTGRIDGDRDTIGAHTRNFTNSWTPLKVTNHRTWSTLVHPRDIQETNQVVSIANITRVFNDEQKIPEMDVYCISKLFAECEDKGGKVSKTALTTETVLKEFDSLMEYMDENRVPRAGRILYVTTAVNTLIKNAKEIYRTMDVKSGGEVIKRAISNIDEVKIVSVPTDMMKTLYDFTNGWAVDDEAKQINMALINPMSVITPVNYEFARLDPPSAGSEGKWNYFEESFEDVFVLPNKVSGVAFNVEPDADDGENT